MREIPLTREFIALVDDEDFESLSPFKWQANLDYHRRAAYALRSVTTPTKRIAVIMHRIILNAPSGILVDHKEHFFDQKIVDNRKQNLRLCTNIQNGHNRRKIASASSTYKGVWRHKKKGVWRALLRVDKKLKIVGEFKEEIQAALAYDNAARFYFGEFARVNFPREGELSCL